MMSEKNIHQQDIQPEEVFKNLYPRLCDFAHYFLKDSSAAEDIVQDVFVVFLEQLDSATSHPTSIKSFLYSSVKHACLNKLRHIKVIDKYNNKYTGEALESPKILEAIIHAEIIAEIHEVINTLPPGCAMIIRYGYLEGLQNQKIAEVMNISLNTVKSQKQRALNLIRARLSNSAYLLLVAFLVEK